MTESVVSWLSIKEGTGRASQGVAASLRELRRCVSLQPVSEMSMGFVYLCVVVAAITATAVIAKFALVRRVTPLDLSVSLFSVSTIIGVVIVWTQLPVQLSGEALVVSFIAGLGGGFAVLAFNSAVRAGHFGFSNAIYRSSFLVPVVYSVLFLGSVLKLTTVFGISLILVGIFAVSPLTSSCQSGRKVELRWFILIMSAFLLSGAPRVGQTLTNVLRIDYHVYLLLSYLSGALTLLVFVACKRSFSPRAIGWGAGAAVSSYAGVFCTLKALEHLTPQVVFPISLSAPVLLGVLFSLLVFKEEIRGSGWMGIGLMTSGIAVLAIWR